MVEKDFCQSLYHDATVKLLAAKYAYYIACKPYLSDASYDGLEKSWYIMGRALELLKEDETSPCVDFDERHPLAKEAIELANRLT
jgi:hypothetical protein